MVTGSNATKTHAPVYTEEGGGIVVTCSCGWLRFATTRGQAEGYHRSHQPKPPKEPDA